MKIQEKISKWFWSDPWNSANSNSEGLKIRLGILRIIICLGTILTVIMQGSHVLDIDIWGPRFYFYDRVTWYFSLLNISHTYPLFDLLNFILAIFCLLFAAIGYKFRLFLGIAIISIFYIHGSRSAIVGNNHHVLYSWAHVLIILFFSRAGDVLRIGVKEKSNSSVESWEAVWPVRLIQIMIVFFYFSAGVAKIRIDGMSWLLNGSGIQRILFSRGDNLSYFRDISQNIAMSPSLCWFFSFATIFIEFVSPVLLLKNKVIRRITVLSFVLFHVFNRLLVGVPFHYNAILLVVFLDPMPALSHLWRKIISSSLLSFYSRTNQ
jgi:hypothetical protein